MTQSTHPVASPASPDPLVRAHDLMRQLGLHGEVEWTAARATVEHTRFNAWGVLRLLHTFTGVRANDARNQRDWLVTTLWAFAMDAVALGLIAMVLSGIYLWLCLPAKRLPGALAFSSSCPAAVSICLPAKRLPRALALAAGCLLCALLLSGLRWLS